MSIQEFAASAVAIAGTIILLILAPGVPLGWMKKLVWLGVALGVWFTFVYPYQENLKTFAICILSVFVFKILTESSVIFITQVMSFMITYRLFTWIFEVSGPAPSQHIEKAPGFSSSRV